MDEDEDVDNVVQLQTKRKRKPKTTKPRKLAIGTVLYETDVARRLIDRFGDVLRYVSGRGWYVWADTHWRRDDLERVRELVKAIVEDLRTEAAALEDNDLWRLAAKTATARGISAVLDLARSDPRVRIPAERLDAQPHLLACLNTTIDLRDGSTREHDRADLLTKVAPTVFDAESRSDDLARLLVHLVPDAEARTYLQRAIGYSLFGHTREDVWFLLVGPPRSGKGTLLRAMKCSLGPHFGEPDVGSFCKPLRPEPPDKPRSDLCALVGRRIAAVPEGATGQRLDGALIKRLVGGDRLTTRELHGKVFSVDVTFSIWMVANDGSLPKLEADDAALWERIRRIPVGVTVPEGERDPAFRESFGDPAARSAFLAWAVEGAVLYHSEGLGAQPASVRAASAALREEHDPIGQCISDLLVFEASARVSKSTVRDAVVAWFESEGERAPSPKRFASALRAAGQRDGVEVSDTTARTDGRVVRAWAGVRLATEAELACRRVDACRRQSVESFSTRAGEGNNTDLASTPVYTSTPDPKAQQITPDLPAEDAAPPTERHGRGCSCGACRAAGVARARAALAARSGEVSS